MTEFDNLFIKIDSSLFDKVMVTMEDELNKVKSKFISSKYFSKKNKKEMIQLKVQTHNLKVFKNQYFKIETKESVKHKHSRNKFFFFVILFF